MKVYAVYRCLYGEDFVKESINSITDYVDQIFVFWTNKAWGDINSCVYKGLTVQFPEKFDSVISRIKELNNPKITLIEQTREMNPRSVPWNLYTTLINNHILPNYDKPDIIIIPEVDQVFRDSEIRKAIDEFTESGLTVAKTRQIEMWRSYKYRIQERRNRVGVVFWNMRDLIELPTTKGNGEIDNTPELSYYVHNFGFAVSLKVMYWKHMTALGFSSKISDSIPNEQWLDKWINWTLEKNNENLEISLGHEHTISLAYHYSYELLPEEIKKKYGL